MKAFSVRKIAHHRKQSSGSYFGLLYTLRGNANTYLGPGNVRGGYSTGSAGQSDGCAFNCAEHLRAILNGRNYWKK